MHAIVIAAELRRKANENGEHIRSGTDQDSYLQCDYFRLNGFPVQKPLDAFRIDGHEHYVACRNH